jgi:hypothetical protein
MELETMSRQCYFIPFVDVYLRSREQISETVVFNDPESGEDK